MLLASGLLGLVVAGAFAALIVSIRRLEDASDERGRADVLIAQANRTERLLLDLETGQRGFVITRIPRFLEPWQAARREFPRAAAELVGAVGRGAAEQVLAQAIEREGLAYERWTDRVIRAARSDPARARALVSSGRGKRQVDGLRGRFRALTDRVERRAAAQTRNAREAADRATVTATVGVGTSVLLILAYALYLARAVSRPMRRLAGTADRLARGELASRARDEGAGEIGQLAQSFNVMAAALEHGREELERRNAALEAAREQAERAYEEADAARQAAERANAAKSEFLSRMSHELRTPLNAILGFGQLLELEELDESQEDSLRHILRGGRHLLELINEVLDISRIEAGSLGISPEPVRLDEALADLLALVAPLAEDRGVRLSQDLRGLGDRHVQADRQRLKQVLLNLLSNAIKYNRRGGRAQVFLEEAGPGRLRILVRDEGAGIPQDRLDRLFTPFDRLGAESGEVEGTGLGLALSKRLVEVMGGTLSLDTSVGHGSTFAVELAAAEPPAMAPRPSGIGLRPRPSLATPALPPASILYIEDNLSNLRLVEQLLAEHPQVNLIPAMQGSVGLELASRHELDLVLLDLHLPDMDGTEVLERLRAEPATREVPVVVLSADATERQIARLMERGARDYLTKPLDLARFVSVLARLLNGTTEAPDDRPG